MLMKVGRYQKNKMEKRQSNSWSAIYFDDNLNIANTKIVK